jgi:prophage maintenance system killer protein
MLTFLGINGQDIEVDEKDLLTTMIALAAGRLTESGLAAWLRSRMVRMK